MAQSPYFRPNVNLSSTLKDPLLNFDTLPSEIIYCVMNALVPRDILSLAHVSTCCRNLALSQLFHVWDIRLCHHPKQATTHCNTSLMSNFELYIRMVLSDLYHYETGSSVETDCKQVIKMTVLCCQKILSRLYASDKVNKFHHFNSNTSSTSEIRNPKLESNENLHVIPRVIADQVSRGICVPETAVLILQCLATLHDQNTLQHVINITGKDTQLRIPTLMNRVSFGVLCFEYLIPNVLSLLQPTVIQEGIENKNQKETLPLESRLLPSLLCIGSNRSLSVARHLQNLTKSVLQSQQELILPIKIQSTVQLTRVLCFLPLLGRHFNALPTSTFIETFLDRSEGDIPIDRAAVMVYGFMCVLDLETGKANLASESYRIFEKYMPTQGVVQAQEIIRMMERHRALIRGFMLSSPTFSSTHAF